MRMHRLVLSLFLWCSCVLAKQHPDWDALRQQIAAKLHVPDPLPRLAAQPYDKFNPAEGVTAERVSYQTAYGLRVPAIVYRPSGASIEPHPALVVVNGHSGPGKPGDKSAWYSIWAGILYARAGAVVLTYDPIGEYERNAELKSSTSQHDSILQPQPEMALRLSGLMITDVMQSVRYLQSRKDVDPKRVAVLGFSMGSFVSALACSLDTEVHACVLAGGGNLGGPDDHWDHGRPMCEATPYQTLSFLGDRGAVLYALNAQRGPTLVINGTADQVVGIAKQGDNFFPDLRKRTIQEAGTDKNVFAFEPIPGGQHEPYFLTKTAALWLEDKLKFPTWTKKQIQRMPETEVAGMSALGEKVPQVTRSDLHAIPEAVWQAQRDDYVYESWVERARAEATQGAK